MTVTKNTVKTNVAKPRFFFPMFPYASFADVGASTTYANRETLYGSAYEASAQDKLPACRIRKMTVKVYAVGCEATITLRVNGASVGDSISVPADAADNTWFEVDLDVVINEGDQVCAECVFGGVASSDFGFRGGGLYCEAL